MSGRLRRASLEERLLEAEERLEDIIDSANNPFTGLSVLLDRYYSISLDSHLGRMWWCQEDMGEPWQTLAACVEIRDAYQLECPEDFVSHLPIHQDGSCNGLQHYAALGRDVLGAKEVNLLPGEVPNDIYSNVAKR